MVSHRLPHQSPDTPRHPAISFAGGARLALARAHEVCGPERRTLALMLAEKVEGPVIWIRPGWSGEAVPADAIRPFINPGRVVFVNADETQLLYWSAETALRSGTVALVVTEVIDPPGLTPVRRLHLAAEIGSAEKRHHPVCLLLTPEMGGAQGIESRWHFAAAPGGWTLSRLKARSEPPTAWLVPHPGAEIRQTAWAARGDPASRMAGAAASHAS